MKSIYIYIFIALALVGCKKNHDIDPLGQVSSSVRFNATLDGIQLSKAVTDVNFVDFGVFMAGYHTTGLMAAAVAEDSKKVLPNLFYEDQNGNPTVVPLVSNITSTGGNTGAFELNTTKYASAENTFLSYYSWAQGKHRDSYSAIVNATSSAANSGYPWLEILNTDDISTQTDIVAARSVDNENSGLITSSMDLEYKHILSKLTFYVLNSTESSIYFPGITLNYGDRKVYSRATYTFNSDTKSSIGTYSAYTSYHTGSNRLGTLTLQPGKQSKLAEFLLVPQKVDDGFLVLSLNYRIQDGSANVLQTQEVSIPATDLTMGVNHVFTIDMTSAGDIIVRKSVVEAWIQSYESLPVVAGKKDALLLLEGSDKPYKHVDGQLYWLDRSGYNRHVRLSDGFVSWSEEEKCYNFSSGSKQIGGEIPSLGYMLDVSMSYLTELTDARTNPVEFHEVIKLFGADVSKPAIYSVLRNLPNNTSINLSIGPSGTGVNHLQLTDDFTNISGKTMWTTQFGFDAILGANNWLVYKNSSRMGSPNYGGQVELGDLTSGRLASDGFRGKLFHVRVVNAVVGPEIIKDYFTDVAMRYGVTPVQPIYLDSFQELDIPGELSSYTVKVTSNGTWNATCAVSGVTTTPSSGGAGFTSVVVKVPANPTLAPRDIPVVFTTNISGQSKTASWVGSQLPRDIQISLDKTVEKNISGAGRSYTVKVTTNRAWSAACNVSGVTMTPSSGAAGETSVVIKVPANPVVRERDIPVVFTATVDGLIRTTTWVGSQLVAPPAGSYIGRDVLASLGWPEDRMPATGLQVAIRGNYPPGFAPDAEDALVEWSLEEVVTGINKSGLGYGRSNYAALGKLDPDMYPIGQMCSLLGDDWYVPSEGELVLINKNKRLLTGAYSFTDETAYYWTSSESLRDHAPNSAVIIRMDASSTTSANSKRFGNRVRCVREF